MDVSYQVVAALAEALPDGWVLERAAGPASRQLSAALDGTTFVESWLAGNANVPRWTWCAALGRMALLVEPARTNEIPDSDFVDAGGNDDPDSWANVAGVAGTNYDVIAAGAPHGGAYFRINSGAGAAHGVSQNRTYSGTGAAVVSSWLHGTSVSAGERLYAARLDGGATYLFNAVTAGTYDWTRHRAAGTITNTSGIVYMANESAMTGVIRVACPQVELGVGASSWIPTSGGAGTRAAERMRHTGAREMGVWSRKRIQLDVVPEYASTDDVGTHRLFAMTANDYIAFQAADDRIIVVNGGSIVAQSAALSFAAGAALSLHVEVSPYAVALGVNGTFVDSGGTGWVAPTSAITPHLGCDVAGANSAPAAYGRLSVI